MQNVVADALSRQQINSSSLSSSDHSQPSSPEPDFFRTHLPINRFKNQILLEKTTNVNEINSETIFEGYHRHTLKYSTLSELKSNLKYVLSARHLNSILVHLENQTITY